MYEVKVNARWESGHTFEFDSPAEAIQFAEKVNDGDLDALVAAGDVTSATAELVDFQARA